MELGDLASWVGVVLGLIGSGFGLYNWWNGLQPQKPKIEVIAFIESTVTDRSATTLYDLDVHIGLVQPMYATMLKGIQVVAPAGAVLYSRDKTRSVRDGGGVDPDNASSTHVRGTWRLGHKQPFRDLEFYASVPEGTQTGDLKLRLHFRALGPNGYTGTLPFEPDLIPHLDAEAARLRKLYPTTT